VLEVVPHEFLDRVRKGGESCVACGLAAGEAMVEVAQRPLAAGVRASRSGAP